MTYMDRLPPDTLCDHELCGHRRDRHEAVEPANAQFADEPQHCLDCETNRGRGFATVDVVHVFKPRKLAGGALNAAQEQEAYAKAMRGE